MLKQQLMIQIPSDYHVNPNRLGNERYKSKPIYETLSPRWLEQFDLSIFDDQSKELEITVWDKDQRTKDDFMGR